MVLVWNDLSVQKNDSRIIDSISGRLGNAEMVAILGASGSGKTTLLNALAGRLYDLEQIGVILIDGYTRDQSWRKQVAYVEQVDLLYEYMTVYESVYYSLLLRLSVGQLLMHQRVEIVENILQQLGILHIRDYRVGGAYNRISGGERKRVNIAMEMVANPKVLFLDEPTSGLDASTALVLIERLRLICNSRGTSILMTIHQPRFEILGLFDKMILICQGKIAFEGTVQEAIDYFEFLGFIVPPFNNPSDYFIDITSLDFRTVQTTLVSRQRMRFITQHWQPVPIEIIPPNHIRPIIDQWGNSFAKECLILISILWKEITRDKFRILAQITQVIVLTTLFGLVFLQTGLSQPSIQNRVGIIFFLTINVAFTVVSPLLNEFPLSKQLIRKERCSSAFRSVTYFIAKVLTSIVPLLTANIIYATGIYWMVGLQANASTFFVYLTTIICLVFYSHAFGLFIGALAPSPQIAQLIGPTVLVVLIIFGGNFVNVITIPSYLVWIYWISPFHYAFQALMVNEFSLLIFSCSSPNISCINTGEQVLERYGLNNLAIDVAF